MDFGAIVQPCFEKLHELLFTPINPVGIIEAADAAVTPETLNVTGEALPERAEPGVVTMMLVLGIG